MGVTLFMFVFDERTFENGWVSYSGQYLHDIASLFSDFVSLELPSIDGAVGIFAKKVDERQPARMLEVSSFDSMEDRISIRFKVTTELGVDSGTVRRGIRRQLGKAGVVIDGPYLPLCCMIGTEDVGVISAAGGESDLSLMHSRLDWIGIHKKFQPIANLDHNHPDVWTDVEALNMIGFACAKLAETSVNLKQSFPDARQKQDFLKQQSYYRQETEALRKRCVELQPNNAGAWSNLA